MKSFNSERHANAQTHHIHPDQRYQSATQRNVHNFFKSGGTSGGILHSISKGGIYDTRVDSLAGLRIRLGIRKNDTSFDAKLNEFISDVEKTKKKLASSHKTNTEVMVEPGHDKKKERGHDKKHGKGKK